MIYYKIQGVAGIVMTMFIKVITMDKFSMPKTRVISPGRISSMPIDFMTSTVCIGKVILHPIKMFSAGINQSFHPIFPRIPNFVPCAIFFLKLIEPQTILEGPAQQVRFSHRFPHTIWQAVSSTRRLLSDETVMDGARWPFSVAAGAAAVVSDVTTPLPVVVCEVWGREDCASSGWSVIECTP